MEFGNGLLATGPRLLATVLFAPGEKLCITSAEFSVLSLVGNVGVVTRRQDAKIATESANGRTNIMTTIDLLKRIWTEDIAKDLQTGTLINERTVQAAMYHHVRTRANSHGLSARLEVQKFMPDSDKPDIGSGAGVPDMVVVSDQESKREVDAVIEFKLREYDKGIVYEKDIGKLIGWAARCGRCSGDRFDVDPQTLHWAGDLYRFTSETSWIFAAIGGDGWDALKPDVVAQYAQTYAQSVQADMSQLNLWLFRGIFGEPPHFDTIKL